MKDAIKIINNYLADAAQLDINTTSQIVLFVMKEMNNNGLGKEMLENRVYIEQAAALTLRVKSAVL